MSRNGFKLKRIGKDFVLRMLASLISIGVRQLIMLPLLAKMMGSAQYGTVLTVISVINIVTLMLGNTLNNVRLLMNSEYQERGLAGDFNRIILVASTLSLLVIPICLAMFPELSIHNAVLLGLFLFLETAYSYYYVVYSLDLDFKGALINSLYIAAGSAIGILAAMLTGLWAFAYLLSMIPVFWFYIRTNRLLIEPLNKTSLFGKTMRKWRILIATSLVANILVYLDRFLLYPIIGADAVSTYNVASFLGKSFGALVFPVSSVLLGYYAQDTFQMSLRRFWLINWTSLGVTGVVFALLLLLGRWATGLFYPTLIDQATPYLALANLAAMLSGTASITQASVMRFARTFWQFVIQLSYAILYVGLGVLTLRRYGIIGFCYTAVITNLIRLLMFYIIGHFSIKNDSVNFQM